MSERGPVPIITVVNDGGEIKRDQPINPDAPFPVLFTAEQKGLVTVVPTREPAPELRPFSTHKVLYLPDGQGAVGLLMDRFPRAEIVLNPHGQADNRFNEMAQGDDSQPIDKTCHIACGPLPYSVIIKGYYNRRKVYMRVNVGQTETSAMVFAQ